MTIGKLMYLIFDILALNGMTNVGMYNLSERLALVGKKVVTVFREAIKDRGKDYFSKLQFTLSGKISTHPPFTTYSSAIYCTLQMRRDEKE
jgi:hypothetical protein